MAAKYQIFISSTFEDLREERDQVIKAVLEMGHIPVGMEMFSAADEQQWQIITRHIDESDYYLVIVAHRYGSVVEGISYTRKEYEYALSKGVPVLGFVIDPKASWPADRVDKGAQEQELLQKFKEKIEEKPVGYWASLEDLHSKCSIALMKAFTASPRDGWVRASTAVGPQVIAELSRLSAENARLRDQLTSAERASDADRDAALAKLAELLRKTPHSMLYRYTASEGWVGPVKLDLGYFFELVAPMMHVEYSIPELATFLALNIKEDEEKRGDIVPHNEVRELLSDLMTFDLVEPSTRKHSVHENKEYWSLTSHGQDLLKSIRRTRLERQALGPAVQPQQPKRKKAAPKKAASTAT